MDDRTQVKPRTRRTWSLAWRHQGHEGEVVALHDGFTVGRTSDCDLPLSEGLISRLHATFAIRGDSLFVKDNDSTNGTYVNDQLVEEAEVKVGDLIHFDDVGFEVTQTEVSATSRRREPPPQPATPATETVFRGEDYRVPSIRDKVPRKRVDDPPPAPKREPTSRTEKRSSPRKPERPTAKQPPAPPAPKEPARPSVSERRTPPPREPEPEPEKPAAPERRPPPPREAPEPAPEPGAAEWESAEVADEGTVILGKREPTQRPAVRASEPEQKTRRRPPRRRRNTGPLKYAAALLILGAAAGGVFYFMPEGSVTLPGLNGGGSDSVTVSQPWGRQLGTSSTVYGPVLSDVRGDRLQEVVLADGSGLMLLSAANGTDIARIDLPATATSTPLVVRQTNVEKDQLVVVTGDGKVNLLSGLGQTLWSTGLGNLVEGSYTPAVHFVSAAGNRVLVPTRGRGVVAIDVDTGQVIWDSARQTEKNVTSDLALDVAGARLFVGGEQGSITAIDVSGLAPQQFWERSLEGIIPLHLVLGGEALVVVGLEGAITALNRQHGESEWELNLGQAILSRPVVMGEFLYCFGEGGVLFKVNVNTGESLAQWDLGTPIEAPIGTTGKHLVVFDKTGQLRVIDAKGAVRYQQQVSNADAFLNASVISDIGLDGSQDVLSVSSNGVLSRYSIQ